MKKTYRCFLFLIFLCYYITVQSQPALHPSFVAVKNSNSNYILKATINIPDGWHIYGNNKTIDGLTPPSFAFDYEKASADGNIIYKGNTSTITDAVWENKKTNIYSETLSLIQKVNIDGVIPASLKGILNVNIANNTEFYSVEDTFNVKLEGGQQASTSNIKLASVDINKPLADCGRQTETKKSIWGIFILGFLGGLIALLTPCVFPMIPVTVSFFTRRSCNRKLAIRNGSLYGFFIFLIYILLSVPFHIAGNVNPEIFNSISTNAYLNIFFFAIFIFFAISFFGYFEIILPSSVANKADEKSGLTSISGIFFMALTLAIVSFSCTGPILGSLLVGSLSGGAWQLTAGLAGFGIALALPFAVFAIFPDLLKSLPKSGGWLDMVKKILAFLEVALAFKFLSNADLVMHWGILKREVFIGIWILTSFLLALYLFGVLRLPHDYKGQKISALRKVLGVIALVFALYLIPGVMKSAPYSLNLLSGFPPPLSYSIYGDANNHKRLEANVVNDYNKALALARQQNKPLLIDFTGWACVNCRKMEENVWTQPEVYNYIKQHFILVSLYVDDREKLPIQQRIDYTTKEGNKKSIETLGDKWATFQAENFNEVSQPQYAILNNDEKLINFPVHYTPEAKDYLKWLQCGVTSFNK